MSTWYKPAAGTVKVNVKGVCDRSEMKGTLSCVMRDCRDKWVEGCKSMVGFSFPITTELWAIFYGMKMAWKKEELAVVVECESAEAVNEVLNPDPNFCLFELVIIIRNLMSEAWESLQLEVVGPDSNFPAAALAKIAMADDGDLVTLSQPPTTIMELLTADKV